MFCIFVETLSAPLTQPKVVFVVVKSSSFVNVKYQDWNSWAVVPLYMHHQGNLFPKSCNLNRPGIAISGYNWTGSKNDKTNVHINQAANCKYHWSISGFYTNVLISPEKTTTGSGTTHFPLQKVAGWVDYNLRAHFASDSAWWTLMQRLYVYGETWTFCRHTIEKCFS